MRILDPTLLVTSNHFCPLSAPYNVIVRIAYALNISTKSTDARADTGVWLFHCHIEWHVVSGLMATFVEAPLELQKTLSIPQEHFDTCAVDNIPFKGNAAGNVLDLFDLDGEPSPPALLPEG